jgi:hypothetical protein
MNRLFTRVMWAVVVIMLCVVCVALAAPAPRSHPSQGVRSPVSALHAAPAGAPQAAAAGATDSAR